MYKPSRNFLFTINLFVTCFKRYILEPSYSKESQGQGKSRCSLFQDKAGCGQLFLLVQVYRVVRLHHFLNLTNSLFKFLSYFMVVIIWPLQMCLLTYETHLNQWSITPFVESSSKLQPFINSLPRKLCYFKSTSITLCDKKKMHVKITCITSCPNKSSCSSPCQINRNSRKIFFLEWLTFPIFTM